MMDQANFGGALLPVVNAGETMNGDQNCIGSGAFQHRLNRRVKGLVDGFDTV